jgi:hypothetical protein
VVPRRYPPQIGTVVIYRSRTGRYDCPAVVVATAETLDPNGVELGHVPPITNPSEHVHLVVLTPGIPGKRSTATDFLAQSPHGHRENVAGTYQEFDIPFDPVPPPDKTVHGEPTTPRPGTWRWAL